MLLTISADNELNDAKRHTISKGDRTWALHFFKDTNIFYEIFCYCKVRVLFPA